MVIIDGLWYKKMISLCRTAWHQILMQSQFNDEYAAVMDQANEYLGGFPMSEWPVFGLGGPMIERLEYIAPNSSAFVSTIPFERSPQK